MGCRDCRRCTEVALETLVKTPFRIAIWFLTFWNLGLVQRKCPVCGHKLAIHQKLGGRFVD